MPAIEATLTALSTRSAIPLHVLRAVWLRGVAEASNGGDVADQCHQRVRDFIQNGPRALDADLWPSTAAPITTPHGMFDDIALPYDANGKLIEHVGSHVSIISSGSVVASAFVIRLNDADSVTVSVDRVPSSQSMYIPGDICKLAASTVCL